MFYYVAIPIYNGMLMLGYATLYTSLPVFCLVYSLDFSLIFIDFWWRYFKRKSTFISSFIFNFIKGKGIKFEIVFTMTLN